MQIYINKDDLIQVGIASKDETLTHEFAFEYKFTCDKCERICFWKPKVIDSKTSIYTCRCGEQISITVEEPQVFY